MSHQLPPRSYVSPLRNRRTFDENISECNSFGSGESDFHLVNASIAVDKMDGLFMESKDPSTDIYFLAEMNQNLITAFVSCKDKANCHGGNITTHLPSLPLSTPSYVKETKSYHFLTRWPIDFDPKGGALSTFQKSIALRKRFFGADENRRRRQGGQEFYGYEPEEVELTIGLMKGKEMLTLGTTTLVISGEETEEMTIDLPINVRKEAVKTSIRSSSPFRRTSSKSSTKLLKPQAFENDRNHKFKLSTNAKIRFHVKLNFIGSSSYPYHGELGSKIEQVIRERSINITESTSISTSKSSDPSCNTLVRIRSHSSGKAKSSNSVSSNDKSVTSDIPPKPYVRVASKTRTEMSNNPAIQSSSHRRGSSFDLSSHQHQNGIGYPPLSHKTNHSTDTKALSSTSSRSSSKLRTSSFDRSIQQQPPDMKLKPVTVSRSMSQGRNSSFERNIYHDDSLSPQRSYKKNNPSEIQSNSGVPFRSKSQVKKSSFDEYSPLEYNSEDYIDSNGCKKNFPSEKQSNSRVKKTSVDQNSPLEYNSEDYNDSNVLGISSSYHNSKNVKPKKTGKSKNKSKNKSKSTSKNNVTQSSKYSESSDDRYLSSLKDKSLDEDTNQYASQIYVPTIFNSWLDKGKSYFDIFADSYSSGISESLSSTSDNSGYYKTSRQRRGRSRERRIYN